MEKVKDFKVIVIVWLTVLTLIWVIIIVRWQEVCDRIALTVLEDMAGDVAREVRDYRPPVPEKALSTDWSREFKGYFDRPYAKEDVNETIGRIEQEARQWHPEWYNSEEVNE